LRGSANAEHHHVGPAKFALIKRTGPQSASGEVSFDSRVQSSFEERRTTIFDGPDLVQIPIDTENVVPEISKADCSDAANITQAHHNYILLSLHPVPANRYCGALYYDLTTCNIREKSSPSVTTAEGEIICHEDSLGLSVLSAPYKPRRSDSDTRYAERVA
jgi:hypothetical protein